jgi:Flp pilus assembly protein TadD
MLHRKRVIKALPVMASALLAFALAGCQTTADSASPAAAPQLALTEPPQTATIEEPGTVKYYPSDEPLRLGLEHFNRGNYGLAERYFRDAVERAPRDVTAWVGLAASYDRLARFDLADRAYRFATKLGGSNNPQILNNQGYSYMLRGNYARARQLLLRAQRLEPNNPTIANNLQLLDGSRQFVRRDGY